MLDEFYMESHAARRRYDEGFGQEVFEFVFRPAFRESGNLSRTIYFTRFLAWAGKVNELALNDIGGEFVEKITTAERSLVINSAQLNVVNEALCFERVLARFRIGKVVGAIIPLRCEFFTFDKNNNTQPFAVVDQDATWVEVGGDNLVRPAEIPKYFGVYVTRIGKPNEKPDHDIVGAFSDFDEGDTIYQAVLKPGGLPVLAEECFSTSLGESSLVGSAYYENYFIWQGKVRDRWLYSISPDLVQGSASEGEMICIDSRLDYLRDAMPFDNVAVVMSVIRIARKKLELRYEYYRLQQDDSKEKLAVGRHIAVWVKRDSDQNLAVSELPDSVMALLADHTYQFDKTVA